MPLLQVEAERLSNNVLQQGYVETIITEDPLFALLDFRQLNGKALIYNRELALPDTDFRAPGDTINESSGKTEEVISRVRAIIGDVDIDNFLDETMGDTNDQEAIQIAMKVKATGRKFRDKLINGAAYAGTITSGNPTGFVTAVVEVSDANGKGSGTIELDVSETSLRYTAPGDTEGAGAWVDFGTTDGTYTLPSGSPSRWVKVTVDASELGVADADIVMTISETKEFTGLKYLVPDSQLVLPTNAAGDNLSWDILDQLDEKVVGTSIDLYMMPKRTIRAYRALLRAAGGIEPAMMQIPNFTGAPVLTLNGKPVLPNEFISTAETYGGTANTTSIYAVSLEANKGLQGLFSGPSAGIRVNEVGELETQDATRHRVKWYAGTCLWSQKAVARAVGIKN